MPHNARPLVYGCSGSSAVSQLANELALRLDRDRLAEMSSVVAISAGLRKFVRKAASGHPVIAIDGCALACSRRVLEARGVRPARAISLDQFGLRKGERDAYSDGEREALFAQIVAHLADVLEREEEPASRARPAAEAVHTGRRTDATNDYLRAISSLTRRVGSRRFVLAADVSRLLGISRVSAGEMLRRLEHGGLVVRGPRKEIVLTAAGRAAADAAVRRHRLSERFLTDFVGYAPAESHAAAAGLADALDERMVETLARRLGRPERCPHGWPLDPAHEREEAPQLASLASLTLGTQARIVCLAEHDAGLLGWLDEHGLRPGVAVEPVREPAFGQLTIRVEGEAQTIPVEAATAVFVTTARNSR